MVTGQDAKKAEVTKLKKLIKESPIVGIVNMQNLPMAQLQRMRKKLRDDLTLYMSKKRLIRLALEGLAKDKKDIEKLDKHMKGMPALMLTKENPFRLYAIIQKNKSKAAAKAGQEAPNDITVSAGPTPFAPGPIISELGTFGLKTKVTDGKIEIIEDHVIAKEGDMITPELASLLVRLGIEPMEIGLDLVAIYEDGNIFQKDVLAIDEEEYYNNFVQAENWAFNLAMDAGILNSKTTEQLVQKAFRNSKAVAIEGNIMNNVTTDEILAKAEREMKEIEKNVDFSKVPAPKAEESAKEEVKEEASAEEVKEASVEEKSEEPKAEDKPAEAPVEEKSE